VAVVTGAAGAAEGWGVGVGVGVGVVEGFRVGEEEIVVGVEVVLWLELLVGIVIDVLVLVSWVKVVDVERVLEVVDAGVAEVMDITTAVGVSEATGGVVLVVDFGI
jgi:hypothetical protein